MLFLIMLLNFNESMLKGTALINVKVEHDRE